MVWASVVDCPFKIIFSYWTAQCKNNSVLFIFSDLIQMYVHKPKEMTAFLFLFTDICSFRSLIVPVYPSLAVFCSICACVCLKTDPVAAAHSWADRDVKCAVWGGEQQVPARKKEAWNRCYGCLFFHRSFSLHTCCSVRTYAYFSGQFNPTWTVLD